MEIEYYLDKLIKYLEWERFDYIVQTEKKEQRLNAELWSWELDWSIKAIKIIDKIKNKIFILKNNSFFNIENESFTLEITDFIFDIKMQQMFIKGILKLNENIIQHMKIKVKNLDFLNIKELK